MPMTHTALVTRLGLEIGISSQEVSDFRLDGLREQGPCPVAQNLSERIAEGPWLSQLDDVSVCHGVSLLWWRSGGVEHPARHYNAGISGLSVVVNFGGG